MRILVTGGLGFLGSHLVDELAKNPADKVVIVDNLSSNVVRAVDQVHPVVDVRTCSVQHYFNHLDPAPFDRIYHLACPVGPVGVIKHRGHIAVNVLKDAELLAEAAIDWDTRLLDVSTSEVYGGGESGYCTEEMPKRIIAQPSARLEYAVAKLTAEVTLANRPDLDVVIVRPFNIAGPRQGTSGGFVIPRFVEQALAGLPLTVYGDGSAIRAFTHVHDTVQGLVAAMEHGKSKEVYNIGNPANRTTVMGLAMTVKELTESDSDIVHVDPKQLWGDEFEEAADKWPDARKAQRELNWLPERSLESIVWDVIEWRRNG